MPGAAGQRPAVEHDRPRVRIIETRDAIEERRLAGAVRADQAADRAAGDLERDVVERGHAAEPDRQPPDRKQGGGLEVRNIIRASDSRLGQLHGLSVPITSGSSRPADGRSLDVSASLVTCFVIRTLVDGMRTAERSWPAGKKIERAGLERLVADREIVIAAGDRERLRPRQ